VCHFRGIPFARPPLGPLRLAAPEPPEPWVGERDATAFSPAPPQRADAVVERLRLLGDHEYSEDCLYLNVTTPDAEGAGRPVLVWLHGGAFLTGTGAAPLYDPTHLSLRGDAVVVTLNYRVGAIGFLHAPGLTPNRGLLDQVAALRWIQEHIAAFGGDPRKVTVFGESAGAGSLCALLAMPSARGLFRGAIVQSAAPDGMLDAPEAERRGALLLGHLGLEARDAAALADVALESLLDAQDRTQNDGPFATGMLFAPVVDGAILPERPLDAVRRGVARDVHLVIGTTREELQLYLLGTDAGALDESGLRDLVSGVEPDAQRAERLISTYRESRPNARPMELYYAITTDVAMRLPSIRLAEAQSAHQPHTFMYLFTWGSPLQDGDLAACHALDLPFVFGTLDIEGMPEFAGKGPAAELLSRHVMDAWLAFARDGAPSQGGIGTWPVYDRRRRATVQLDAICQVVDAPQDRERTVWEEPS
jgi:para-nitrobenzyl esterase